MKFTKEQIKEVESINNIDDLLRIFKRLIYLSDIPYKDLSSKFGKNVVYNMLDDMFQ